MRWLRYELTATSRPIWRTVSSILVIFCLLAIKMTKYRKLLVIIRNELWNTILWICVSLLFCTLISCVNLLLYCFTLWQNKVYRHIEEYFTSERIDAYLLPRFDGGRYTATLTALDTHVHHATKTHSDSHMEEIKTVLIDINFLKSHTEDLKTGNAKGRYLLHL